MKRTGILGWTVSMALGFALATPDALAVPKEQREKEWGNANIAARANLAARALKDGNFPQAVSYYRGLVGLNPQETDFYLALYFAAGKGDNWKQAAMALDELFDKFPEYKSKLMKQYAEALQKAERTDEAKDVEKLAKKGGGDSNLVDTRVGALIDKSIFDEVKAELPKQFVPPPRNKVDQKEVRPDSSKYGLTFDNAFWSENIVIAEYLGYEKGEAITFYRPPKAYYRIEKRLKGAPLNPRIAVRYEFTDKSDTQGKPKDWKFDESLMPKKGSKWILFIPNAVPFEGMLETYQGSFGRQEMNDDNYDKIMKIIEQHKGQTR